MAFLWGVFDQLMAGQVKVRRGVRQWLHRCFPDSICSKEPPFHHIFVRWPNRKSGVG